MLYSLKAHSSTWHPKRETSIGTSWSLKLSPEACARRYGESTTSIRESEKGNDLIILANARVFLSRSLLGLQAAKVQENAVAIVKKVKFFKCSREPNVRLFHACADGLIVRQYVAMRRSRTDSILYQQSSMLVLDRITLSQPIITCPRSTLMPLCRPQVPASFFSPSNNGELPANVFEPPHDLSSFSKP